jgi:protein Tex
LAAAVNLMDEGATVPFIARYRKEVTGSLDDTQLRELEQRLAYLRELEARRQSVIESIFSQGKLDAALLNALQLAADKQSLEDLYLPFKQKRRTKAQIAIEAGLQPLAQALLGNPMLVPEEEAAKFLRPAFTSEAGENPGVPDTKAALDGARQILMETFAEAAPLLADLRELMLGQGLLVSRVADQSKPDAAKFSDYFEHQEPLAGVPSHRALAMLRGRREEVLKLNVLLPEDVPADPPKPPSPTRFEQRIAKFAGVLNQDRPADAWLAQTVKWTWQVRLAWSMENDALNQLRERSDTDAIEVFGRNLKDVLLAAPAGAKATMGLDPGLRTGVKVAVVDATGKLVDTATIYPHVPRDDWQGSLASLAQLVLRHNVELIAIGNGTASRETDKLAADLIKGLKRPGLTKVMVSEAGASVYSASELAAKEFPQLDVSLRGAVSIARRLQDPMAELVKIDPKSIGVGQYQHDVNQVHLAKKLDAVIEDCVNAVGVELNNASVALLSRVAGLNTSIAENIVRHRDQHGAFRSRQALLDVARLGPKTFEQAAGFLRIRDGEQALDASAVHPEAYPVVKRMLDSIALSAAQASKEPAKLRQINPTKFVDEKFGLITLQDVLKELEKPGRDPRPEFKTAQFQEGIESIQQLKPGMVLEGVVTNVANFGAFVDIGVHQDGLVHVSALANKFVANPHEVVKAGQLVKVKVMEVDVARKRIGLSMRMGDEPSAAGQRSEAQQGKRSGPGSGSGAYRQRGPEQPAQSAFALALQKAKQGR